MKNSKGEGNLIFCCTGLTDLNFWNIKIIIIIIMISHIYIFFIIVISSNMIFFLLDYSKIHKNKNLVHLILLNHRAKKCTFVDIKVQVFLTRESMFLFLDMPTLKLKIIIIILLTGNLKKFSQLPVHQKMSYFCLIVA